MRWYVEVSRVGESGLSEKYCVDARQWQAALQEARKLRGDSGALSKFSIELLDDGYRAVDSALKLRYLVTQAPSDAPLSEESGPTHSASNGASDNHLGPFATSVPPDAKVAPTSLQRASSQTAPRPASSIPGRLISNAPARAPEPITSDQPVPPAPRAPTGLSAESEPPRPASPPLPAFEVVRQRAEEPRSDSPITYREVAYAVKPGATRSQIEALLWVLYKEVAGAIEERAPGKFVQLAVFDHVFQKRPERPPLATFAWKDWRGAPVLAFPGFGEPAAGPMSQVPPPTQSQVPPSPGLVPSPLGRASSAPVAPAPAAVDAQPAPVELKSPVVEGSPRPASIQPTASVPPSHSSVPAALVVPALEIQFESTPSNAVPLTQRKSSPNLERAPSPSLERRSSPNLERASSSSLERRSSPNLERASSPSLERRSSPNLERASSSSLERRSSPSLERPSRPRLSVAGRRRAGEDLIGELFEVMHDLHFMRDIAAGAEFVLSVLNDVLPCEGVLIHVFDINTNHFVVVRAKGPNARSALMQRMPDQEPLALSVMRSSRAVSIKDAAHDPRFKGPRWQTVGVEPAIALCGAVRQGGRYLGLIELANPFGGTAFHATELNALDYICEQFAEFLSNKPIILAADVILPRN